jgi:ABC-2 type transport system permease protein
MNSTIASITARGLFGRKRALILIPLPLLLIGIALLSRAVGAHVTEWAPPVIVGLGFSSTLPVIALIVGTGVLGSEIDDGTVTHILAKPIARSEIVMTKLLVAIGITALVAGLPLFIVGLIAGQVSVALAVFVAAIVGAIAYCSLFVALSLVTRRPVLFGLAYVVLWEGVLGNILSGTQQLSVAQYIQSIADWLAPSDLLDGTVSVPVSIVMSCLFAIGFTALAIQRLRSFSVAGETG